jgi:hypothetical protein
VGTLTRVLVVKFFVALYLCSVLEEQLRLAREKIPVLEAGVQAGGEFQSGNV